MTSRNPDCLRINTSLQATMASLVLLAESTKTGGTYHANSPFFTTQTYPGYLAILDLLVSKRYATSTNVLTVSIRSA